MSDPSAQAILEARLEKLENENAQLRHELAVEKHAHGLTREMLDAAKAGHQRLLRWLDDLKAGRAGS